MPRKKDLTFEVMDAQTGAVHLESAILVYAGDGRQAFATVHQVAIDDAGQATILAGKAMTAIAVARLARRLTKRQEGGFVPPNLLYRDGQVLAWWVPPSRRQIWFRGDAEKLGGAERSEVVPHPGLVFAVTAERVWKVWAVKGIERPTPETLLFRAPYMNVWDSHAVCAGNVATPAGSDAERIDAWNEAWFRSYFTHPNGTQKIVEYRGGAYAFWRHMLDGRHPEFPERVLVGTGKTVRESIEEARRGRS